jgi:hypothetical protein
LTKLKERIVRLAVDRYYFVIAKFFQDRLTAAAYEWPNPSGFTYYLQELTESGNQTIRAYVSLYLSDSKPGMVHLYFHTRAVDAVISARPKMKDQISKVLKITPTGVGELWVKSAEEWAKQAGFFSELCSALVDGWKKKREEATASDAIETLDPTIMSEEPQ